MVACSGTAAVAGEAERGGALFEGQGEPFAGNVPTCISCHPIEPGEPGSIGTNLSNIGNRASTEVPGQAPEEYLRLAILEPDVHLAGGFQEGIHYREYDAALSQQQVADLIAFMLTLRSGED